MGRFKGPAFLFLFVLSAEFLYSCGGGGGSTGIGTSGVPSAPTGVEACVPGGIGSAFITVSWNPVPGAVSYNVYYSTQHTLTPTDAVPVTGITATTVTVNIFDYNESFFFIVTAVNIYGVGPPSSFVISHFHGDGSALC
jgi:hypothetical protein